MIRQLRYAAVALLLASCSTVLDGQIQDVTIETQGAKNTLCYMQNGEFSFRFYPPQTLKVTKSDEPYTIRCLAPGNREKTIVVEPTIPDSAFLNVANLGTGFAVDHLSASMYELPSTIVISFEGMPPGAYEQPAYNQFFDQHPHLKGMEEFRPGQAALQRDAATETPVLKMRQGMDESGDMMSVSAESSATVSEISIIPAAAPPAPSGSAGMSAEDLTRQMNPHVFGGTSTPAATRDPVSMDAP